MENFDYTMLENEDFSVGKQKEQREKVNYVGGAKNTTWPLTLRVVVNQHVAKPRPYVENHFHEYTLNGEYMRIPCARSVGKSCAICDAHWKHRDEAAKLEQTGAKASGHKMHEKYLNHATLAKAFEQKRRFAALVVLRGDDKVSVLDAKTSLIKAIFGDASKKIPGAVHKFKDYNAQVYNPAEPTGWLVLNKTGEKLDTRYFADLCVESKMVGRQKTEMLYEQPLSNSVKERLKDPEKMIDLTQMIASRLWSEDEVAAFVASEGTELPSRLLKKQGAGGEQAVETPSQHQADFSGSDEENWNPF